MKRSVLFRFGAIASAERGDALPPPRCSRCTTMEHISPLVSKAAAFATANKEMLRAVPFALGAYCIVR